MRKRGIKNKNTAILSAYLIASVLLIWYTSSSIINTSVLHDKEFIQKTGYDGVMDDAYMLREMVKKGLLNIKNTDYVNARSYFNKLDTFDIVDPIDSLRYLDIDQNGVAFKNCLFTNAVCTVGPSRYIFFDDCKFPNGDIEIDLGSGTGEETFGFIGSKPRKIFFINGSSKLEQVNLYSSVLDSMRGDCEVVFENPDLYQKAFITKGFKFAVYDTSVVETAKSYEALLTLYKEKGYFNNYKSTDISYKKFMLRHGSRFSKLLWWVPEYWTNYGYSKQNVFYWTFIFVLIFTMANYFIFPYLNANIYRVESIPIIQSNNVHLRMWYSFIYTSTIFFKLILKHENVKTSKPGPFLYLMLIYILGIISLAYMANFVIQK